MTDEEIGFMLREGAASGHIPEAETAIVEMALRLGDRRVSTVMTPRTRIEWLDLDDPEEETRRKIRTSRYSRFPVVKGGSAQVVGVVQAKDLLAAVLDGQAFDLRAATRPPTYLPNTVSVLRVLEMFKISGAPMELVVDEYGDLEGLVTPSDILEALVGEISGTGDGDQRVVRRDDGTWLVDGMLGLDELKQVLGLARLPGEDVGFHTVGGYMMARLNRVPTIADQTTADGYRFEVVAMDGRRVDRVLVSAAKAKARRCGIAAARWRCHVADMGECDERTGRWRWLAWRSTPGSWRAGCASRPKFTLDHAEAAAEALAEALGGADLAAKVDLRDLEQRLTIKFGGMLIVAVGVILAALRYLPGDASLSPGRHVRLRRAEERCRVLAVRPRPASSRWRR